MTVVSFLYGYRFCCYAGQFQVSGYDSRLVLLLLLLSLLLLRPNQRHRHCGRNGICVSIQAGSRPLPCVNKFIFYNPAIPSGFLSHVLPFSFSHLRFICEFYFCQSVEVLLFSHLFSLLAELS